MHGRYDILHSPRTVSMAVTPSLGGEKAACCNYEGDNIKKLLGLEVLYPPGYSVDRLVESDKLDLSQGHGPAPDGNQLGSRDNGLEAQSDELQSHSHPQLERANLLETHMGQDSGISTRNESVPVVEGSFQNCVSHVHPCKTSSLP